MNRAQEQTAACISAVGVYTCANAYVFQITGKPRYDGKTIPGWPIWFNDISGDENNQRTVNLYSVLNCY